MDKLRFKELLKKEGYRVADDAAYPTVIVEEDKVSKTYISLKLLAKKVGYNHTFGVKKSNIKTKVVDGPEATIESKVIDWPEEEENEEETS